jgi:hypothetical protein
MSRNRNRQLPGHRNGGGGIPSGDQETPHTHRCHHWVRSVNSVAHPLQNDGRISYPDATHLTRVAPLGRSLLVLGAVLPIQTGRSAPVAITSSHPLRAPLPDIPKWRWEPPFSISDDYLNSETVYRTRTLPSSATSFTATFRFCKDVLNDSTLEPRILNIGEVESGFNFIYEEGPDGPRQSKIFQLTERVRLHHS